MIRPDRRTLLAGLAAGLLPAPLAAQPRSAGRWTEQAPLPWPAQEIYAAVVPGSFFVVTAGGMAGRPEGGIDILDRTAVYTGSRWQEGPRLPRPTHHPVLAAANERVFAFGGYVNSAAGQWTATTDVFAMGANTSTFERFGTRWVRRTPMPAPQSECVALEHKGLIHLITGRTPRGEANGQWSDQIDTDAHRVFNPDNDRWTSARPAPAPRNSAAGAVIRNQLYVVGGRTVAGGATGRLDRYDPRTDRWETLRPMPQPSGGLAAAVANGKLYAMGGEWFERGRGSGVFKEVWEYDPARDSWRAVAPMRTPRHGLAAVSLRNEIFAIGGAVQASARGTSAVVESWR